MGFRVLLQAKRMEGKGAYKRLGNGLPPIPFSLNRSNGGANRETMSSGNLSTTVDADLDKKQKRWIDLPFIFVWI